MGVASPTGVMLRSHLWRKYPSSPGIPFALLLRIRISLSCEKLHAKIQEVVSGRHFGNQRFSRKLYTQHVSFTFPASCWSAWLSRLFWQARYKDKGTEIASDQLTQVTPCLWDQDPFQPPGFHSLRDAAAGLSPASLSLQRDCKRQQAMMHDQDNALEQRWFLASRSLSTGCLAFGFSCKNLSESEALRKINLATPTALTNSELFSFLSQMSNSSTNSKKRKA